ncbi:kinase-like domain-containing protein [Entophlyctis helioformis]|nr:kinase-like domain-containing protein [Entophlyctis helioformis]
MAASQVQGVLAYMDEHETHGSASVDDRGTDDVPGQTMGFSYANLEALQDHASAVAVLSKVQQFWTHHGVTVVFGRGRSGTIVCVKHKPRGHAKEIAMTRWSKDLTGQAAGIVLVEELLFHDHTLMRSASQAAGLPRLVTYILHGLAALEHLAARRIAHCDISKNNFMFSRDRQMWCLTDFGGAAQIPAGSTSIHRERLYGTDPFIAPEALSDHVYSIASDLWSFGMVAFNVAEDVFSSPAGRTLAQINAECRVGSEIRAEIRRLTRNQPSLRAAASDVRQAFVKLQRRVDELANSRLAAQVEPMDEANAFAVADM